MRVELVDQEAVDRVDVLAAARAEAEVMEAGAILVEALRALLRRRAAHQDAGAAADAVDDVVALDQRLHLEEVAELLPEGEAALGSFTVSWMCAMPFTSTVTGGLLVRSNDLLFDLDPKHRGFFAVDDPYQTYIGVFTASEVEVSFDVRQLDRWRQFVDYLREGIQHIWLGIDHVLFLIALLLPAPLVAAAGGLWLPRETFRAVGVEVLKVVTAFTVAHSITLSLAVLGALRLPGRWVEAAIAFSVFAAAWNNLRPFLPGRPWLLAFGFGLVHGLGFAGALSQLGLPRQAKGLALLAFNLGVEIGQLAIVALILPAMFAARRTPAYQRIVLRFGSLLIAWIAAVWLIERLLGFELIPLP